MRAPLLFLSIVIVHASAAAQETPDFVEDEVSFGQRNLYFLIEVSGGFGGKILLQDTPGSWHEERMLFGLTRFIPDHRIVTWGEAIWGDQDQPEILYESLGWYLPEKIDYYTEKFKEYGVRVVHSPNGGHVYDWPENMRAELQVLENTDTLIVYGVGNITTYPDIDLLFSGAAQSFWDDLYSSYQDVESFFQGGHAIMASYAIEKPATFEEFVTFAGQLWLSQIVGGDIQYLKEMYEQADKHIRYPNLIPFGDLGEYGYTVLLPGPDYLLTKIAEGVRGGPSASFASAHVSVFAFYLFQLWDTTEEVVAVMQQTATDIGEPGPDAEFGWGLINADHPIIWNRLAEIGEVEIPDSNLRAVIKKALVKMAGAPIILAEIVPIISAKIATLTKIEAANTNISDLTGLEGATNLTHLELPFNSISDLSPLVANTGLGAGDTVDVRGNPLSYLSINTHIPALQSRGVTVEFYDPDVNGDGSVNVLDLIMIVSALGNQGQNLALDINGDRVVDVVDLVLVAGMFDDAAGAPSAQPQVPETLTAVEGQRWLTDARALKVRDAIMKRGFVVLEQLLASLTPKETELLSNYPNPFNPETWIPYRLAEDASVTLTIYDSMGQEVRTIDVGHQPAAVYENRSKAIYWDGRNGVGEIVGSGVYFYHLSAGEYSATRKMVILK